MKIYKKIEIKIKKRKIRNLKKDYLNFSAPFPLLRRPLVFLP